MQIISNTELPNLTIYTRNMIPDRLLSMKFFEAFENGRVE